MAAIVGIDDTDSRERGMCTTYAATVLADRLEASGRSVTERRLFRLHPAVEHKTRGNAALALVVDGEPDSVYETARSVVESLAEQDDDRTHPGLVVAPHGDEGTPSAITAFAREAMCEHVELDRATSLADRYGYRSTGWGIGRGRIGALAAVGAGTAVEDWTYEHIVYRPERRWGTERDVDIDSVFEAAAMEYPTVWDTVDRVEGEAVCVPNTPGPVLFGIRGDDPVACRTVAAAIDHEPAERSATFATNQGTDSHLRDGDLGALQEGRAYRVDGVVATAPDTRPGGHVFFELGRTRESETTVQCAAFEPTKRFRDRVRALRPGDRLTVCGEFDRGTIKLEKFAVRQLVRTVETTPTCEECGRTMESAGADQGYRCRNCTTTAPGTVSQSIERELEPGWYEVPPCARRHVATPLIRGGFDAPTHPER